jgi:Na+/H+ antiporter NhaA
VHSRLAWAIGLNLVVGTTLGISAATVAGSLSQLAYDDPLAITMAKVGIFAGSLVRGVLGAAILAGR